MLFNVITFFVLLAVGYCHRDIDTLAARLRRVRRGEQVALKDSRHVDSLPS